MSLYNALFGKHPAAGWLMQVLGINTEQFPVGRFRDCYPRKDDDKIVIVLYTRNGGGNREEYQYVFDALSKHPLYMLDFDDDFDCTYAYIVFRVPAAVQEDIRLLLEMGGARSPREMWDEGMKKLQSGDKDDPFVKRAMRIGENLTKAIADVKPGDSPILLIDKEGNIG